MLTGSGSNLKLADYFARCLPTITTPFGARGYRITPGVEAVVCPLDQFTKEIQELVGAPLLRERMGAAAYQFAKDRLDWQFQAAKYRSVLERGVFGERKKKLLVVTHRFTIPPLGGAESHLIDLLKAVASHGDFLIDLVTTDITKIENQFHFSCSYERSTQLAEHNDIPGLKVIRFPVDELDPLRRLENAGRLWATWMDESLDLSLEHLEKLPNAILLGGWYYPERDPAGVRLWSGPRALIKVKGLTSIRILGSSNRNTVLTIIGDGKPLAEAPIEGDFELNQPLNGIEVLELRVPGPYTYPGDPRQLGVRIHQMLVQSTSNTTSLLALDLNYSDVLKRIAPREYVKSLIDVARRRPAELDALFQETRGPNSSALEEWLEESAKNYDVILGHSLPFKTVVIAADAARVAGVPLVQLPSAHIDDVFYHWQSYFEALRTADVCITHPRSATEMFFQQIGARSGYFPPGMKDPEIPSPEDDRAFRALYDSNLPYVLVLGRKDRSKNYHSVIRAVSSLNTLRRRCNVVMIGRDEDGDPLDGNFVDYLGAQPDGIVRSALRNSLCLVTMSDSESFGIVILEAWSQSRPVIVSENCLASTELVVDGECGLVANITNLPEKIASLLDSPHRANEMGARGYARVQAEFRWEVIGAGLNDLLFELTARERQEVAKPGVFA
jgi:glycosyltransferase involved in cell wall biosynthesis